MRLLIHSIAFFAIGIFISDLSLAQSSQYTRPNKKATPSVTSQVVPTKAGAKSDSVKKDEKVDLQKLESDYWEQKDTDFHVVQNRKFTKTHRAYVSVDAGLLINDSFTKGSGFGLSGGYYLTEQSGFELSYIKYSLKNSKSTSEMLSLGGSPAYNKLSDQIALTYSWMPIYGKISLFDKSIIYYDMGLHMGLGLARYDHMLDKGKDSDKSMMFVFDVTQQFFLTNTLAFKFDVRNRVYKNDRLNYKTYEKKSDTNFDTTAVLGLMFYFK